MYTSWIFIYLFLRRLSSRVEIIVNVVDINDNSPRFEQKQYSASILENVSIGMDILEANAVDYDMGNNGRLRFTILSGDPRGKFFEKDIHIFFSIFRPYFLGKFI